MSHTIASAERAVRVTAFGDPGVMRLQAMDTAEPGPGQARVRHRAIGLNYLDVYQREGHYSLPLPTGLGVAGAGMVEALGSGVDDVRIGDRVAYAGVPPGSYATSRLVAADRLVPVPDAVDDEVAAATLQQGITARFLLHDVFAVRPGHRVLFHAAAGGLGTLACQWARHLGAQVIGVVGSAPKAVHALQHGCHHVIDTSQTPHEALAGRVHELTGGAGVHVVYDSVGQDTFDGSLRSLAQRGLFVSFGSASGPVPPLEADRLGELGSLYFTRPRLVHYTRQRADLLAFAADYFSLVAQGLVRVHIGQRYPLADVVRAHHDMQSRLTVGSSVLLP